MSQTIDVNGQSINYPETGDTNWGDEATDFAVQTSAALGKLGLASGTSVDIAQTLDVTGNTTLDANLSVGGNASVTGNITVNGNSNLGNGTSDTTAITGILNVDSGVLYVDPTTNKVGINDATPSVELDVNGAVAITGNETVGGTFSVTGATTLSSTLGVSGNATFDGVTYLDDDTTANTPVISFTGDTNTGIGRSAADTLDLITNGNSRFRIEPTGQIKAVYESQVGTDYNTQLDNGYLCRAWVNFNGTGTVAIRASGNVSSITDNNTGDYTINFTTPMPDINYCPLVTTGVVYLSTWAGSSGLFVVNSTAAYQAPTVNNFRIGTRNTSGIVDFDTIMVVVLR